MPTSLPSNSSFEPIQVLRIDIDSPLANVTGVPEGEIEQRYKHAHALICLHDEPIGWLQFDIPPGGLPADEIADIIWGNLADSIFQHLKSDDLTNPEQLTVKGLTRPKQLPCWSMLKTDLPFVSIVIPTRDRASELKRNLYTILQLEGPNFEVVVVDNASKTDETEKMIAENFAQEERIRYVKTATPGISNARNLGAKHAQGDIVAYTDDDVIVDRNWLRAIVRGFIRNPQADAVTGLVIPAALDTQAQQWFEEYGGFNKGYQPRHFTKVPIAGDPLLYPYSGGVYGTGNNAAFKKAALETLGIFDLALGVGAPTRAGEDLDSFMEVVVNGGGIAYEPAALIGHFHREDYPGLKKQMFNYGVGLAAVYTKWLLKNPIGIGKRIPQGLRFLLDPKSDRNKQRTSNYPKELITTELKGMALGPIAFAQATIHKLRKPPNTPQSP